MRSPAGIALLFAALALSSAGCPGLRELPAGAYDPARGMPFEGFVRLDDERTAAVDPAALPEVAASCRGPLLVVVSDVRDGDTLEVNGLSEPTGPIALAVRLIGVDTPEVAHPAAVPPQPVAECYGNEAGRFTELLRGHVAWLTFDQECEDGFGRLLAYAWVGQGPGDLWQRQLLRRGFADTLTIRPNDAMAPTFAEDRSVAMSEGLGLWSACP